MSRDYHISSTRTLTTIGLSLAILLLAACGGQATPQPKTYTIGVVNYAPPLDAALGGFKAGMAELGYVEGENITYIYHGVTTPDTAEAEVKSLVEQKVDLLLTLGLDPALLTKKAVEGTNIPVVFAPAQRPVEEGLVESIANPGGNVTGIQLIQGAPKALEWLLKIAPTTKQVYVFYSPQDQISSNAVRPLPEAAAQLKIELILDEVSSSAEALEAIRTLPEDTAIFLVPTPNLESGRSDIPKLARQLGIPTGSYLQRSEDLIFNFATDLTAIGKQAAGIADKILKGGKPADVPVETAEFFLTIDMKTANAINLSIPDDILRQADTVIR